MNYCAFFSMVVLAVVTMAALVTPATVHFSKRAVTAGSDEAKPCSNHTPCGWAVYTPFIRTVDYFMKNTCLCPKEKTCLRSEDDLSVSAYVYRCRVEDSPSEADTEPPS